MKIGGKLSLLAGFLDALAVARFVNTPARTAQLPPAHFFCRWNFLPFPAV